MKPRTVCIKEGKMKRYSRVMAAILSIALVVSSAFVGDAFAKQQGGKKRGKTVKRSVQFINGVHEVLNFWKARCCRVSQR